MKKFMAMLLALVMALSLVACGQKADDTKKDDAADTDDSLVVLENVVDWGETEPYRVLVQKGDPKGLLEGINKAIAELTANDGALIKEIEDKVASQDTYMPDAVSSDLAAETTDDTAASDKPVLVMGTSPDYPPYEFFADAAMTEYAGIDVEVGKYIAESMGMELQIESMNFDNLVTSLSNGDFDMVLAACEYGLDGDFTKLVNPTGRFVLGGSYADCGVTGRKLACDTYGGIGRMGGGALSGKDPTKVDRSAAYMARKIAKDIVQAGYADKCEVQLAYAIGVIQPVGVAVECFGTEHQSLDFIEAYVHDSYDLTPQGIIKRLGLLDVDYNKVSAYGHFGKAGLPWED